MQTFFFATLTFNIAVLTVLSIGIIMIMRASINLVMLAGTFGALAYKKNNLGFYINNIEKIMPASIAHMLHSRAEKGMMVFTAEESHSIVDWIEEKFSHQNKYTNYFIGTALMIGLLGTFSGLIIAIDDMGKIILSLSGDIDLAEVIAGFAGPLGGMATGFGSSLFGVVAAIILGMKGYILNKNQEMLIEGIEDWMKGRIIETGAQSSGPSVNMGNPDALPDARGSFMDLFIENMSTLSNEMKKLTEHNERFQSATIASIEASKHEHEITTSLLTKIHSSLENIDRHTYESNEQLTKQFDLLEQNIIDENKHSAEHTTQLLSDLFSKLQISLQESQSDVATSLAEVTMQTSSELQQIQQQTMQHSAQQSQTTAALLEQIGSTLASIDQNTFDSKEQLEEQFNLFEQNIRREAHEKSQQNEALLIELFKKLEAATMENSQQLQNNAADNTKMLEQFSTLLQEQLKTGIDFAPVSKEIVRMRQVLENPATHAKEEIERVMAILQENFTSTEQNSLHMLEEQRNLIEVSNNIRNTIEAMDMTQQEKQDAMIAELNTFSERQQALVNNQRELIDVTITRGDQLENLIDTQTKQLERNGATLHHIGEETEKNYKANLKISKNIGKGASKGSKGTESDNFITKMFK